MQNASAFSAFKLMHLVMLIGQLLFIASLFYLGYTKRMTASLLELDKIFQVIALLFSITAFFIGNTILKKRITTIRESATITSKEKFEKYRSACIIQWALLEGAALFNGICFFLTGNYAFLALALVLLLLFGLQVPGKTKMALQLNMSIAEIDEL